MGINVNWIDYKYTKRNNIGTQLQDRSGSYHAGVEYDIYGHLLNLCKVILCWWTNIVTSDCFLSVTESLFYDWTKIIMIKKLSLCYIYDNTLSQKEINIINYSLFFIIDFQFVSFHHYLTYFLKLRPAWFVP